VVLLQGEPGDICGSSADKQGFDNFAPLGPVLVSSELIPDPAALHLKTSVNGEVRQDTPVADLVFDVSLRGCSDGDRAGRRAW
jgi:2-keto-4-pentenoate hydratase/2-oxohepta-3-ene-1,7-dioic acid hydratase in catechol pathway